MMKKVEQNETLSDKAYKSIKKAILFNEFSAGELLPEEGLASILGISRTPIRKAITQLANEGLVQIENGKIARVAVFSQEDAINYLNLRQLLETYAASQAAVNMTGEQGQKLEEILKQQKRAIEDKDYSAFIDTDINFHMTIATLTKNQKLEDFIEQLHVNLHRFLILRGALEESVDFAYFEHYEILKFLKERNSEKAANAMENHIEQIRKRVYKYEN
ncbi:GntR family transcriptional regulator [Peribacillus muralis]|uniref:GntR family transcriptional regulator n=1 Tax=Peribacillus muralis TaxID=264697 RepID=UPI00070ECEF6|nr:GntR family transcriptional regulator [Peribacillus muralis]MCK1995359.1 GntR family transcriptional regulator [Peribacillus muralis]MCK2015890.1 GntR family transcriptional regulator [Peribacillus muralis]